MDIAVFKQAIATTPKGANVVLEWIRPAKTRKGVTSVITKHVRMIGRVGIEYDNINDVQEKRESGELPQENAGLPWGEWIEYPFHIGHKGVDYARMYFGTSSKVKPFVKWHMDGKEVAVETVAPMLLASETVEKDKGDCFTVKVADLVRLGKEVDFAEIELETNTTLQTKATV